MADVVDMVRMIPRPGFCARFRQSASACTNTGSDGYYVIESDQHVWDEAQRMVKDVEKEWNSR